MPNKRNRNPLAEHAAEKRYKKISQTANHYLGGKALIKPSSPERRKISARKRTAATAAWKSYVTPDKTGSDRLISDETSIIKSPLFFDTRRTAIFHLYLASGTPKQCTWEESNFVSKIMKALLINNNSRSGVIKILNDCAYAAENNVNYESMIICDNF